MENFYTAYTKVIQNQTFYFVKRYVTFPEFKEMPAVLENYGMHIDFAKACDIASITNEEIRKNLLEEIQNRDNSAKVIHMNMTGSISAAQ